MQLWKKQGETLKKYSMGTFPRRCLREPLPKIVLDILERREKSAVSYQEWLVFSQIEWDILFARAKVLMLKRRERGALVTEFLETILRWQTSYRIDVIYLNPDGTRSALMVPNATLLAIEFPNIRLV